MGYENILVPLDSTESSEIALRQLPKLAAPQAKIHLLSVIAETMEKVSVAPEMWPDDANEVATREAYLNTIAADLKTKGYEVSCEVRVGAIVGSVAEIAKQGFDIVLMATHRRSGIGKFVLGSVSESLLHHTHCPVLIV
jgi:nucleotide-binding universal stress UspA family protein